MANKRYQSVKDTRDPCIGKSCGNAACHVNSNGKPHCVCVTGGKDTILVRPDENLNCPEGDTDHVIRNISNEHLPIDYPISSDRGNGSILTTSAASPHEHPIVPITYSSERTDVSSMLLKIAVPVCGIFIVCLCMLVAMLLYTRKRKRNSIPERRRCLDDQIQLQASPVAWLNKEPNRLILDHMNVLSKNPNYFETSASDDGLDNINTKLIPRESLQIMEEIGEGAFGKVYKGQIHNLDDDSSLLVAVKILKLDVSSETKDDIRREVEIMSSFDHHNIVRLIGIVSIEHHPPYMIFEFMEHGDLADLLRKSDPYLQQRKLPLNQEDLVDISIQIASGMVYLTSHHFVHRDLATRNCLVGKQLVVRISDFGMSRDIYTCDYYKIRGTRMLPVRWMSPESVKYGKFTTESDVWAYGVVLWELFTYAKQPYYGHTNEEVIHFIEDGILLQRPKNTPSTVYHVMLACWRTDPTDRFTFQRIHRHLVDFNKNMVSHQHEGAVKIDTLC